MPLIKNEQDEKRNSQFLAYESGDTGNSLILKSHLYKVVGHFLKAVNRSVICREDECAYCAAGYPKKFEYNFWVFLNGQLGFLEIKPSVFFDIQKVSKAQKKDIRQISWTVIKTGDGLATAYTTSKEDNLDPEDYQRALDELDENTQKLVVAMEKHEVDLSDNYVQYLTTIRSQVKPVVSKETAPLTPTKIEGAVNAQAPIPDTTVNPKDIPF